MEARWFIDAYGRKRDFNPILLEFAGLDFNMVQAKYQEDIRHASRYKISNCEKWGKPCKDGRIERKFKKRNEECRESRVVDKRRILITVFSLHLLYHLSCIYS